MRRVLADVIIAFPKYHLHVYLERPEATVVAESHSKLAQFLKMFRAEADRLSVPLRPFNNEDFGIAKKLVQSYELALLEDMVYYFWQLHGGPVYYGEYAHALRLFSSKAVELSRRGRRRSP
jgi:hypothetical protein